ncbi:MAG: hypothetical protein AB8B83_09210 [Bdellovibrionales bacterium]
MAFNDQDFRERWIEAALTYTNSIGFNGERFYAQISNRSVGKIFSTIFRDSSEDVAFMPDAAVMAYSYFKCLEASETGSPVKKRCAEALLQTHHVAFESS